MKRCSSCSETKPYEEFYRQGSRYQAYCKACKSKKAKNYYQENQPRFLENRLRRKENLYRWYWELKSAPCADCKSSYHPVVMQWDHVAEGKVNDVSRLVTNGSRKETILAEIAKCELVCANCHAMRTYKRAGAV